MKKGPEALPVILLARALRKAAKQKKAPVWERTAELLERPARRKHGVNLYSLQKHCADGQTIVVPGKLLSQGTLSKKLTIAALSASSAAQKKLATAGCKLLSIKELVAQNPEGKNVRIII